MSTPFQDWLRKAGFQTASYKKRLGLFNFPFFGRLYLQTG